MDSLFWDRKNGLNKSDQLLPASIRLSIMLLSTLVLAASCVLITSASAQKLRVVACEGSVAQLKCDKDEVISVTSAAYGRRDQKTCAAGRPANQIVNVRCSRSFGINPFNILPKPLHLHKHFRKLVPIFDCQGKGSSSNKVAENCNGKQSCSITAANSVFGDPCVRTYKYLEVDYTCENPEGKPESGSTVACERSVAQLKCGKITGFTGGFWSITPGKCLSSVSSSLCQRPEDQIANVRCSSGNSDRVGQSCNGKQSCSITAANSVFGDPCVRTYKYLEVDYICYACLTG
ncbi:L-rhamnose-binding lectin CSL3-like [Poeciliopsis prolifica]|uniref:L-rhamnose-binding lectin CSL3-like n=1 Tax=Poeciliopsis prolifica TaxID=188132 RepID=UPI0024144619|nr:L-rhamnose-binding lectin CSL3-like [Poeciliopsis prolifica]